MLATERNVQLATDRVAACSQAKNVIHYNAKEPPNWQLALSGKSQHPTARATTLLLLEKKAT